MAVLALAVAGCGGGGRLTKGQYEDKLQGAGNELSGPVQQLTQAATKDEFKDDVSDVQEALDSAADTLDGVTPPRDVEGANDRLVHGLRGLAEDFGRLKDAADQSIDVATLRARQVTSGAAARETRQAIEELRRHGYDVGRLGT